MYRLWPECRCLPPCLPQALRQGLHPASLSPQHAFRHGPPQLRPDALVGKTKTFDFDVVQDEVNKNIFNCDIQDCPHLIQEIGKTTKGTAMKTQMTHFAEHLGHYLEEMKSNINQKNGSLTIPLRQFVAKTVFNALFDTVFGSPNGHAFNGTSIFPHFDIYHRFFNLLWLGLPRKLCPGASTALENLHLIPDSEELMAREDLSGYIRTAINFMKDKGKTEQDMAGHNLIYLHINYNVFRILYWATLYLFNNEKALAAIRKEIEQIVKNKDDEGEEPIFCRQDVDNMEVLDSFVKESLRMASGVFMMRYVTEDTDFTTTGDNKTYKIRKGDRIGIFPPALHYDPEIFDKPMEFQYDRFLGGRKFYKDGQVLENPIMPFAYRCVGQRVAFAQIKCYLLTVAHGLDIEIDEEPQLDKMFYGHEILPPVKDVPVIVRLRSKSEANPISCQTWRRRSSIMKSIQSRNTLNRITRTK